MPRGIYKRTDKEKIRLSLLLRKNPPQKGINLKTKNGMYSHGMAKTKFYRHWRIMKNRCVSEDKKKYYSNVNVSKEWNSFICFKKDMYKSYLNHVEKFGKKKTSIDRINNNLGYRKSNCRWATPKVQANNRRNNKS